VYLKGLNIIAHLFPTGVCPMRKPKDPTEIEKLVKSWELEKPVKIPWGPEGARIDAIIDVKVRKSRNFFKVKWAGSVDWVSWEARSHLIGYMHALHVISKIKTYKVYKAKPPTVTVKVLQNLYESKNAAKEQEIAEFLGSLKTKHKE
jgi:hypothetical protein